LLHTVLNLTRPLVMLDEETTGLNTTEARIVEIGFQIWTAAGLEKEWRSLINPEISIPEEASRTNHITDASMKLCNRCAKDRESHPLPDCEEFKPVPRFRDIAASLAKGFTNVDFAGKNVRYDLRVLSSEMVRVGVPWNYVGARIIDADRLEQLGEPRTLSHLYEKHTGKKMENAHEALADVRGTTEIIVAQMRKYSALPRSLDMLHELQWPGWIDENGKFKFVNGVATCMFGKWRDRPMKAIEPSYWDWICRSDFPPDIKALAEQAKLGKFPEAPSGESKDVSGTS